jgi:hypothetical protein
MIQTYRCQACKVLAISNYFRVRKTTKIPAKIKSVGFTSGVRLCQEHKMKENTNNFFSVEKKNPLSMPAMFYTTSDRYHLNQARTRLGLEHYLCCQARTSGRIGQRPGPVQTPTQALPVTARAITFLRSCNSNLTCMRNFILQSCKLRMAGSYNLCDPHCWRPTFCRKFTNVPVSVLSVHPPWRLQPTALRNKLTPHFSAKR